MGKLEILRAAGITLSVGIMGSPALAQTVETLPDGDLEDIVVTARKIPEPVRETPLSISVFDEERIDRNRLFYVPRLVELVPNAAIINSGDRYAAPVFIRGIGAFTNFSAEDPAVTTYIDDIPQLFRAANQRYLDVSQVEVLRGPQGTVFGRNTQAGAIRLTTRDPGATTGGEAFAEILSPLGFRAQGSIEAPLSADLAARGTIEVRRQNGDIDNILLDDREVRGERSIAAAAKFLWKPTELTQVRLSIRGEDGRLNTPNAILFDNKFDRQATDLTDRNHYRFGGAGLDIQHELNGAVLTSLTGYSAYDYDYRFDLRA